MRGRRPQPAEVKAAKGNPGRRKLPKPPPDETAAGEFAPPFELKADARRIWNLIAPDLARMKFLRATDRYGFGRWCWAMAQWIRVTEKLANEDLTYISESQHGTLKRINSLFIVQQHLERRLIDHEDRFGLTPQARQRILQHMMATPAPPPTDLFGKGKPKSDQPGADAPPPETSSPIGLLNRSSQVH